VPIRPPQTAATIFMLEPLHQNIHIFTKADGLLRKERETLWSPPQNLLPDT